MRWQAKPESDQRMWHLWFAWYPVTVGQHRVWLETVKRRGKFSYGGPDGPDVDWEYA